MKIVTHDDWEKGGSLEKVLEVGDCVPAEIVDELRNVLPPVFDTRDFFQMGEPYSHEKDEKGRYKATFVTFQNVGNGLWEFCGHCFYAHCKETWREAV